jgi:hypothetical protein
MAYRSRRCAAPAFVLAASLAACSSPTGGPVDGPADDHCGTTVQATDPAVCMAMGTPPDEEEEAATLYNAEGDDDDCKYHVAWTADGVEQNADATFTVTLTSKVDGKPVTGAKPYVQVYLSNTHPAPEADTKSTEDPAGTYKIGPVRFDASGKWTVRYHFFDECTDIDEATPHSHVAFFVDVP